MNTVVDRTRRLLALLVVTCALSTEVAAQGAPVKDPAGKRAERVSLIVRPRVADTLWLQLDQVIEMSAGPSPGERREAMAADRGAAGDPPPPGKPAYGPRRISASARITRMHLFAHSVVEASDLASTEVLATTDSLLMWAGTAGEEATAKPTSMPLPIEGRHTRVRVTPDGTMLVSDPPPGAMTLGTTLAAMPGMLPASPVAVGEKWEHDIPMSSLPIGGMRTDGILRATFRLDSLTRAGKVAWISMAGTLRRDGSGADLPIGTRVVTAGTIRGQLVVDRVRAWITDARTVIDVRSEVTQAPGMPGSPMLLDIRVTQRVRVR